MDSVRITRALEFQASLRLFAPGLSAEENEERFGAEARRHGHNYRLEVTLIGEPDSVTGMVMDLKELKEILAREIEARFDHRDLNEDTDLFEKLPPTPEHLVVVIAGLLQPVLGEALDQVRIYAGSDCWADWFAERPAS